MWHGLVFKQPSSEVHDHTTKHGMLFIVWYQTNRCEKMTIEKLTISAGVTREQLERMEALYADRKIDSKSAFIRDAIDQHLRYLGVID